MGKTREHGKDVLSRDQVVECMRYLGWHTRNEDGSVPDDVYHVAAKLAGRVTENITLPSTIASEMDAYRAAIATKC